MRLMICIGYIIYEGNTYSRLLIQTVKSHNKQEITIKYDDTDDTGYEVIMNTMQTFFLSSAANLITRLTLHSNHRSPFRNGLIKWFRMARWSAKNSTFHLPHCLFCFLALGMSIQAFKEIVYGC